MKNACKRLINDLDTLEHRHTDKLSNKEAKLLLDEYNELVAEVNHSNENLKLKDDLNHFRTMKYELEILKKAHEILEKYDGIKKLDNYDERKFIKSDDYFMKKLKIIK